MTSSSKAPIAGSAALASNTTAHRWLGLTCIAVAQLIVALDATVINIALPSAQRALAISDPQRQRVITAYTLAFGGLVMLGGRVALPDDFSRQRRPHISTK
jgi:MFS family permease